MSKSVQILFGEIAEATNNEVISTVISNLEATTETETNVTQINYQYGHEAEISTMLTNWQKTPGLQFNDFPLIWLREDLRFGRKGEFRTVVIPSVIIAYGTQGEYLSVDREVQTFNPVLRPIYYEFLRQISRKREFRIFDPSELYEAATYERKMWGRPEDTKAEDVFNGHVDAIEILNLELTLNDNCLTTIN